MDFDARSDHSLCQLINIHILLCALCDLCG
jgi:hypothetical protein